jgi:hypothetical protein
MAEIFNVFPLSIYVDKINKHEIYKENFYKVYPKYDYVENERSDTVSEGQSDPIIHLEPTLSPLFTEIADHVRSYISNEGFKGNTLAHSFNKSYILCILFEHPTKFT